jgi:hypothetical protein
MKALSFSLAAIAAAALLGQPAAADVLLIEAIAKEPANSPAGVPRPRNGQTMTEVEGQFGAPEQKLAPVGTPGSPHMPPITRWVYPAFTVYFENDQVIESVLKR